MSVFYCNSHKVQSKYSGVWEKRLITLDSSSDTMLIQDAKGTATKSFPLCQVSTNYAKDGYLSIQVT